MHLESFSNIKTLREAQVEKQLAAFEHAWSQLDLAYAKAKNLPFLRIVGLHAFRNASIPALTLAGWEFIRALAGFSVIVETVFAWPGIGFTAIQAIERSDLILLQAIVFVVAVLIVVVNITIDILYKLIDPRIKLA